MCAVIVANNRITVLPDKFGPRSNLSLLDCSGNRLKNIPFSIRLVPHLEFYTCLFLLLFLLSVIQLSLTCCLNQSVITKSRDFHKCSFCLQVSRGFYHWLLVTMLSLSFQQRFRCFQVWPSCTVCVTSSFLLHIYLYIHFVCVFMFNSEI